MSFRDRMKVDVSNAEADPQLMSGLLRLGFQRRRHLKVMHPDGKYRDYRPDYIHYGIYVVLEIDGPPHLKSKRQAKDMLRDYLIRSQLGFETHRFPHSGTMTNKLRAEILAKAKELTA